MKPLNELKTVFPHWEVTKDLIDQCIDIMLNLRQSGHPGGSRSKVHGMVATILSGAMRWDIRDAGKRLADRYVLVAGHANPVVYATLAVLNEAMRIKFKQTGDSKYTHFKGEGFQLVWEDLLTLRRNKGLPGHAEMEGKTLFFKFNTGPSGHGSPAAAGEALALKYANVPDVKVFAFEGEGGFTTGASHETINSAWGLGLGNLVYFMDWNDYGIDDRPFSSIMYGTPEDWFGSHGWHVEGTMNGEDWESLTDAYYKLLVENAAPNQPKMIYAKMRKGRGYYKYDHNSHGAAHNRNSELFWKTKEDFSEKYNIDFEHMGQGAPDTWDEQLEQAGSMFSSVFSVMETNQELVDYLSDTLVDLGNSVPDDGNSWKFKSADPIDISYIISEDDLPNGLFLKPGEKAPNRIGFSKAASYINTRAIEKTGRPLVVAMSADLADSTNISGFAKGWDGSPDLGLFNKDTNPESPLMPQGITEFTNAGMMAGLATVNFSENPYNSFSGFYGAMSTYHTDVPIIAVHLTRPPVEIPDREALGMAPHFDASKGAYLIKDYNSDKEKEGVVIVRGTSSTNSVVSILPQLKENGPNIKIVAAISWGLFQLQPKTYRDSIMTAADWYDSMIITNSARRLMQKWTSNRIVHEYTLSPDWDNRWRTGGSLNEIVAEAQLDPESVLKGIKTFGRNRKKRLSKIKSEIPEN